MILEFWHNSHTPSDEGFTGDDVTYLYNVTSDHKPTMVDWVVISA